MAATVVDGLTASFWAERKPDDYKGQDLDKALKAYEVAAKQTAKIPASLIPPVPDAKVSEIEDCLKKLKSAATELEKAKGIMSQVVTALQAVIAAASKTVSELNKLAKGKDADETKYKNAVASANSVSAAAAGALKNVQ